MRTICLFGFLTEIRFQSKEPEMTKISFNKLFRLINK